MQFHEAFGRTIKRLRKEQKLTQKILAEKSDLSIDYIHDIEHGIYNPTLNVVVALAMALKMKTSELIQQTEIIAEMDKN